MTTKHKHLLFALTIIATFIGASATCHAQCATCAQPTVAFYQPTVVASSPVVVQQVNTGWYPGYFWDRLRMRGATTVVTAMPVATTSFYAPQTFAVAAAPACSTCSTCSSCTASYAPACSTCSSCQANYAPACSTCSTCAMPVTVSEVVMRPVCDSCSACSGGCTACSGGCSSCAGGSSVSQAVYEAAPSAGCPNCAQSVVSAPTQMAAPPAGTIYQQQSTPQPTMAPSASAPPEPTFRESNKPEPAPDTTPLQPIPKAEAPTGDSSTNIQAPQLFNPSDRAAKREIAPVWTAVYHKTAAKTSTSATRTAAFEQPAQDADGWSSASK